MDTTQPILTFDTREKWPHPWQRWIGERCILERGWKHPKTEKVLCLPTGDICTPDAWKYDEASGEVVFAPKRLVERKGGSGGSDFYGCCTSSRERFSAELIRILDLKLQHGTETQIVVECSWHEALQFATIEHAMKEEAFRETVAAWQRRFCPIVFAGSERSAACYSLVFLTGAMQ